MARKTKRAKAAPKRPEMFSSKLLQMKFHAPVAPIAMCGESMRRFGQFLEQHEEPKLPPMDGININDSDAPWTDMILSGKKTIETRPMIQGRTKGTLHRFVGKRVGIVRTGKGPATLVGYATVGEPIEYRDALAFDRDFPRHGVTSKSPHYIGFSGKWGYPMLQVRRLDRPFVIKTKEKFPIVSRKVPNEAEMLGS